MRHRSGHAFLKSGRPVADKQHAAVSRVRNGEDGGADGLRVIFFVPCQARPIPALIHYGSSVRSKSLERPLAGSSYLAPAVRGRIGNDLDFDDAALPEKP